MGPLTRRLRRASAGADHLDEPAPQRVPVTAAANETAQAKRTAALLAAQARRAEGAAEQALQAQWAAEALIEEHDSLARTEATRREMAEQQAEQAQAERAVAEAQAQRLKASLEAARADLLERELVPVPAKAAPTADKPAGPRVTTPPRGQDVIRFATRGGSPLITVVLALGALVAAGMTVYEAYLDHLTQSSGYVPGAVTLVLAFVVSRIREGGTTVSIDRGIVQVETEEGRRRFDLTSPGTVVEMIGKPGEKAWKVMFVLRSKPPYSIDDSMVHPEAFAEALRRWRPEL